MCPQALAIFPLIQFHVCHSTPPEFIAFFNSNQKSTAVRSPSPVNSSPVGPHHLMFICVPHLFPISSWPLRHRGAPPPLPPPSRHRPLLPRCLGPPRATPSHPEDYPCPHRARACALFPRAPPHRQRRRVPVPPPPPWCYSSCTAATLVLLQLHRRLPELPITFPVLPLLWLFLPL